jgi:hypothetical protein
MRFFNTYFIYSVVSFGMTLLLGCDKKTQDSIAPTKVSGIYIRGHDGVLERLEIKRGGRYTQEIYKDNKLVIHSKGTWWTDGPDLILNDFVSSKHMDSGDVAIGNQKLSQYKVSWGVGDDEVPRITLDSEPQQDPTAPPIVFSKIKNL